MQGITYQMCLDLESGKRVKSKLFEGSRSFFRHTKIARAGDCFAVDVFKVEWYGYRLATIAPDNTITLSGDWPVDSLSAHNRVQWLLNAVPKGSCGRQWWMKADRYSHGHCEQPVRIRRGPYWTNEGKRTPSMPFTPGMKFRDGELLNPEIVVERMRRVNREDARQVKRETEKLRKLMHACARIGAFESVELGTGGLSRIMDRLDLDEPTIEDVERLFRYGLANAHRPWRTRHDWHDADKRPGITRRAVNYAMNAVRQHLYDEYDSYRFVEVKREDDQRLAA